MFGTVPANLAAFQPNYGFYYSQNIEANFAGYIKITTGGSYTFSTNSDDGSVLFLGTTALPPGPERRPSITTSEAMTLSTDPMVQSGQRRVLTFATPGLYAIERRPTTKAAAAKD